MPLQEYKKRRDFKKTKEPKGTDGSPVAKATSRMADGSNSLIYVIQKHKASHLHYDLRLEMNGVLKSWAVPKEPSVDPAVKRLAIAVEDHPLGYEKFTGMIPEGEYGAGTVEIWDRGTYQLLEQSAKAYVLEITGKKLKGLYYLVKLKPGEDLKNWLFFRKK
ncbi:MAG: DNA polymerase ligase N-terminal domain-containing protein [bacterium]|nr:DNA polymerase ligase N-terminal domain-containing protein [bacterium]MDD5756402.1 DNA polymerase ligase N-terminal domain-containing protein [bacterium]